MAASRDQAPAGWPVRRHRAALARCVAAVLLLNPLIEPDAASAASPSGSQFQVNSYTAYYQVEARVASDSAGNFVVVWTSYGDPTYSIQGQRYAASGSAIGAQFQVSTSTPASQQSPSIASDAAGDFIVVWQNGSSGSDCSVQGRRYDSSGSPIGGEFQVNSYTTGSQDRPSVASDSAGNFVVVWQSDGSSGADASGTSVQGQRYDASGSPIGGEFQVNSYVTGNQNLPSVASDSAGNFVVVWQSNGSSGADASGTSVQGQRYDASGSTIGGEFQVNTYTTGNQGGPSIASDSAGNFVVVWESFGSAGSDTSAWSVHGQSFDASGSPAGAEFQVNSYTTDDQFLAAVASNSAGTKFVVVWESNGSAGSDTSDFSVQGQRYLPEPALVPSLGAMLAMMIALAQRGSIQSLRKSGV